MHQTHFCEHRTHRLELLEMRYSANVENDNDDKLRSDIYFRIYYSTYELCICEKCACISSFARYDDVAVENIILDKILLICILHVEREYCVHGSDIIAYIQKSKVNRQKKEKEAILCVHSSKLLGSGTVFYHQKYTFSPSMNLSVIFA